MLQVYTISELAEMDKVSRPTINARIKKGEYYIPVIIKGEAYKRNKEGHAVRYILIRDVEIFLS